MMTLNATAEGEEMFGRKKHTAAPPQPAPRQTPEEAAYREAKEQANLRVRLYGHAVLWGATTLFLMVVAGAKPAIVVALAWGIWLAVKAFHVIWAPELRRRWTDEAFEAQLTEQLRSERQRLEGKHSRSLEALSASIAHEIRNPITAAKSLVQQMGEDPRADENVEYAQVALEELDRVERSISHLLRYARDEELKLERMQLEEVVESAVETFRDRVEGEGVVIRKDLDGVGEMRGDPEKIRRVLINLISNALDALAESDQATPEIVVSSGQNLAGTELWLKVRDNGPGIPEDRMTQIWSPFATGKAHGTGLGLAISKKLIEVHDGTIEVSSEEGRGTEFIVTLPTGSSDAQKAMPA